MMVRRPDRPPPPDGRGRGSPWPPVAGPGVRTSEVAALEAAMSANGTGAAVSTEDELIDVLRRHGEPAHFIWRGKLYRVRQVLSHWIQVGADSGELPSVLLRTDRRL